MTTTTGTPSVRTTAHASAGYRWLQLLLGVACMVAAANIQYAWTLFVPEIQKTFGWQRASIQTAFTLFILVQTWLTPLEGYLIDRFGRSEERRVGKECRSRWSAELYKKEENETVDVS